MPLLGQVSNITELERLKNKADQPSSAAKGHDRGHVLLSYATGRTHHIDIEWVDHDHKARIQRFWELLDKHLKFSLRGVGQLIFSSQCR